MSHMFYLKWHFSLFPPFCFQMLSHAGRAWDFVSNPKTGATNTYVNTSQHLAYLAFCCFCLKEKSKRATIKAAGFSTAGMVQPSLCLGNPEVDISSFAWGKTIVQPPQVMAAHLHFCHALVPNNTEQYTGASSEPTRRGLQAQVASHLTSRRRLWTGQATAFWC